MHKTLPDPRRLDVAALAESAGELSGQWPLSEMSRLADMVHRESAGADELAQWDVRGEKRKSGSGPAEVWLHLHAHASCLLVCQRCLQPVATAIDAQRSFMFVAGEAAAAELDAQCEDDVLALTRELDLRELVEDELMLSLPLVPKHEQCPSPLVAPQTGPELVADTPHPFAVLAALRRGAGNA